MDALRVVLNVHELKQLTALRVENEALKRELYAFSVVIEVLLSHPSKTI